MNVVEMSFAWVTLLKWALVEQHCCNKHCWGDHVGVHVHFSSRFFWKTLFFMWCKRWRGAKAHCRFLFIYLFIYFRYTCKKQWQLGSSSSSNLFCVVIKRWQQAKLFIVNLLILLKALQQKIKRQWQTTRLVIIF